MGKEGRNAKKKEERRGAHGKLKSGGNAGDARPIASGNWSDVDGLRSIIER